LTYTIDSQQGTWLHFKDFYVRLWSNFFVMTDDIKKAQEVLYQGGIILYPTDTIWGIGCDATNEEAVRKVYELKKRVDSKALIVLVGNPVKLEFYVREVPEIAWDLVDFAEKPLTIIYPGARNLASNLLAEDGSVGIRVTKEAFSMALCERFHKAIVSTSANVSGQPSPRFFGEISSEIVHGVDYVVRYRQDDEKPAAPSSIIKLGVSGQVEIIRK
jgi:L-threonylcarbamoyladenylate synthase